MPLVAPPPPPGPPPSLSSTGSRSSGTWRLLILDTPHPVVSVTSPERVVASDVLARHSPAGHHRSSRLDQLRGDPRRRDFTHTRTSHADASTAAALFGIRTRDILFYPPATRELYVIEIRRSCRAYARTLFLPEVSYLRNNARRL